MWLIHYSILNVSPGQAILSTWSHDHDQMALARQHEAERNARMAGEVAALTEQNMAAMERESLLADSLSKERMATMEEKQHNLSPTTASSPCL